MASQLKLLDARKNVFITLKQSRFVRHTHHGRTRLEDTPKRKDSMLTALPTWEDSIFTTVFPSWEDTPKSEDSICTSVLPTWEDTPIMGGLDYDLTPIMGGRDYYLSPPIMGGHSQKGGSMITLVLPSWEDTQHANQPADLLMDYLA